MAARASSSPSNRSRNCSLLSSFITSLLSRILWATEAALLFPYCFEARDVPPLSVGFSMIPNSDWVKFHITAAGNDMQFPVFRVVSEGGGLKPIKGRRTARARVRRAVSILIGLLVVGLSGLAYISYRRDIHQARERISMGGQIVQTPCGPIEYALAGDGPPVLVVHGAGGGYDQGLEIGEPLVNSGFRVIAMSRFGYLRTPLPGDAPPMQTPAGTEFLFDTALKSDFLFWAATRLARSTVTRAILATPPAVVENSSADEQARIGKVLERILPVSPRRLGLLNDAAVTSSLQRYELERIAIPTLVVSAADDLFGTFDGARYTAEHVPRARFIGYPTGGHLLVGRQKEVTSEMAAFLK